MCPMLQYHPCSKEQEKKTKEQKQKRKTNKLWNDKAFAW